MKITNLKSDDFSLKNIAVQFDELSAGECTQLMQLLARTGKKVQLNASSVLAFLDVFELSALTENWSELTGKAELEKILAQHRLIWSGQNFSFDLTTSPIVYSIVNVTPDSFYDGAADNLKLTNILKRVESDLENGAAVIELGGKSSRPGYEDISPDEEWQRLAELLREIKRQFPEAVIAVDTDEPDVMAQVLDAGADIINDIDGFDTAEKLEIIERYKPTLVVMNNGRAGYAYADNVFDELPQFFSEKLSELTELGFAREQICIDPGVGFFNGPSGEDSVRRVQMTEQLTRLGLPVMIAISRKSFMGSIFGYEGDERLFSTLMFEAQMIADGGRILRVHDVKETKRMIDAYKIYREF